METETPAHLPDVATTQDPKEELRELKLAVKMFCNTMEMCAMISGGQSNLLQIQIQSELYKKMKSKI